MVLKYVVRKFIAKLLPINSLEVGEFSRTALFSLLWRKILRILCKLFPKLFNVCLMYSIAPKVSGTIIDLGCGAGYTFGLLKAIDFEGKLNRGYSIGIDIFLPYLEKAKEVYDTVILGDVRYLPIRKAELALLIGVLEHLEKDDGIKLLNYLTKVCSNIIISTPFGWHPLHPELDRDPYQKHRSAWFPTDLTHLGFNVIVYEHPKLFSLFRRVFQRHIILRHLITPLSSIIYIRKSPLNIQLAFILAWRYPDLSK